MLRKLLTATFLFLLSNQAFAEAPDLDISSSEPWLDTFRYGSDGVHYRLNTAWNRDALQRPEDWVFVQDISALTQMTTGRVGGQNAKNSFSGSFAYNYNHQHDVIFTYNRHITKYVSLAGGAEFERDPTTDLKIANEGFAGLRYMLPFMINALYRVDFTGAHKLELNSGFQISDRTSFAWYYDTDNDYRLTLSFKLREYVYVSIVQDSIFFFGGGLRVRF